MELLAICSTFLAYVISTVMLLDRNGIYSGKPSEPK